MAGFGPALNDEQTRIVADWMRAANDPAFRQEKEKPHQGEFLLQLFGRRLGYIIDIGRTDEYSLRAESGRKRPRRRFLDRNDHR
jgi:hypothetical protein